MGGVAVAEVAADTGDTAANAAPDTVVVVADIVAAELVLVRSAVVHHIGQGTAVLARRSQEVLVVRSQTRAAGSEV